MALPSNPEHGSLGTLNNNDYTFDSDINAWVVLRNLSEKTLRDDIDSEITVLRGFYYQGAQSAGFPVGSVVPFAGSLPQGFLLANGLEFNIYLYPQLYEYLGSNTLPDYTNRSLSFKAYDLNDTTNYEELVFGIAAYNGAGITTDSDIISAIVASQVSALGLRIAKLEADRDSDSIVIQDLREDLEQAIADRVYTDNLLSQRISDNDSDISQMGRFYVQSTPPSGGPNSGWVNTNNMKLSVWDITSNTWIETTIT